MTITITYFAREQVDTNSQNLKTFVWDGSLIDEEELSNSLRYKIKESIYQSPLHLSGMTGFSSNGS